MLPGIMEIDKKLLEDIKEYCSLNNLKTKDFINNLLQEAFIKEKYGERPFIISKKSTFVTTEVTTMPSTVNIVVETKKVTEEPTVEEKKPVKAPVRQKERTHKLK